MAAQAATKFAFEERTAGHGACNLAWRGGRLGVYHGRAAQRVGAGGRIRREQDRDAGGTVVEGDVGRAGVGAVVVAVEAAIRFACGTGIRRENVSLPGVNGGRAWAFRLRMRDFADI